MCVNHGLQARRKSGCVFGEKRVGPVFANVLFGGADGVGCPSANGPPILGEPTESGAPLQTAHRLFIFRTRRCGVLQGRASSARRRWRSCRKRGKESAGARREWRVARPMRPGGWHAGGQPHGRSCRIAGRCVMLAGKCECKGCREPAGQGVWGGSGVRRRRAAPGTCRKTRGMGEVGGGRADPRAFAPSDRHRNWQMAVHCNREREQGHLACVAG